MDSRASTKTNSTSMTWGTVKRSKRRKEWKIHRPFKDPQNSLILGDIHLHLWKFSWLAARVLVCHKIHPFFSDQSRRKIHSKSYLGPRWTLESPKSSQLQIGWTRINRDCDNWNLWKTILTGPDELSFRECALFHFCVWCLRSKTSGASSCTWILAQLSLKPMCTTSSPSPWLQAPPFPPLPHSSFSWLVSSPDLVFWFLTMSSGKNSFPDSKPETSSGAYLAPVGPRTNFLPQPGLSEDSKFYMEIVNCCFVAAKHRKQFYDGNQKIPFPLFIVGHKSDLTQTPILPTQDELNRLESVFRPHDGLKFIQTSVNSQITIENLLFSAVSELLLMEKIKQELWGGHPTPDIVTLRKFYFGTVARYNSRFSVPIFIYWCLKNNLLGLKEEVLDINTNNQIQLLFHIQEFSKDLKNHIFVWIYETWTVQVTAEYLDWLLGKAKHFIGDKFSSIKGLSPHSDFWMEKWFCLFLPFVGIEEIWIESGLAVFFGGEEVTWAMQNRRSPELDVVGSC